MLNIRKREETKIIFEEKRIGGKEILVGEKKQRKKEYTRINQRFCNISVCAGLQRVYHVTEAVQAA